MVSIELDEKYSFSKELLERIDAYHSNGNQEKNECKALLKELSNENKALVKQLKKDIKIRVGEIKLKYKDLENNVLEEQNASIDGLDKLENISKKERNELLSGINIKAKRAKKDLVKARLQDEIDEKRAVIELRKQYSDLHEKLVGKNNFFFRVMTEQIEEKNSTNLEKKLRDREFWMSKISLFSFAILLIFYILVCLIGGSDIQYEKIIQDSSVIVAVSLGGVFIYSMRSFDMSLGAGTAVAAAIGALIWNKTHTMFLVLLVGIVIGIIIELINSALASVLKLPVMVTTLAMASVLNSILENIMDNFTNIDGIKVTNIRAFDNFGFYIGVLVVFFLVCAFLFKITPIGRRNKMIGANATSSRYSGINIMKQGLITFTIAGCAIGVGAMLYITKARYVNDSSCSTIGLDVILAIVFGGMQTTGGPKSKISAAITGGLSATLITYILIALYSVTGVKAFTNYDSLVKGALFLIIVTANTIGSRTKRLPAIEMLW